MSGGDPVALFLEGRDQDANIWMPKRLEGADQVVLKGLAVVLKYPELSQSHSGRSRNKKDWTSLTTPKIDYTYNGQRLPGAIRLSVDVEYDHEAAIPVVSLAERDGIRLRLRAEPDIGLGQTILEVVDRKTIRHDLAGSVVGTQADLNFMSIIVSQLHERLFLKDE